MSEFDLDISEDWQKAESIVQLARELVSKRRLKEALNSWKEAVKLAQKGEMSPNPQTSIDSSSVLWEIAEEMALAGEVEKAKEVAAGIKNNHKRQQAQHFVAEIIKGGKGSFNKNRNNLPI